MQNTKHETQPRDGIDVQALPRVRHRQGAAAAEREREHFELAAGAVRWHLTISRRARCVLCCCWPVFSFAAGPGAALLVFRPTADTPGAAFAYWFLLVLRVELFSLVPVVMYVVQQWRCFFFPQTRPTARIYIYIYIPFR